MKKLMLSILVLSIVLISCKNEKPKEVVETKPVVEAVNIEDGAYIANVDQSTLEWKGFKPTGFHNGTVAIKEGGFTVANGNLTAGSFVFDMAAITVLDIPADDDGNAKLVKHLAGADFFDVEKFATATFTITEVTNANLVKGDLTIKGITKSIEFPVTLTTTETGLVMEGATFKIDRTEFKIEYKSQKFFDDLKDKFINDEFEISFKVVAAK